MSAMHCVSFSTCPYQQPHPCIHAVLFTQLLTDVLAKG
jgi:hypothetical protein